MREITMKVFNKALKPLAIIQLTFISLMLFSAQAVIALQNNVLPKAFTANYTVSKGRMTLGNLHASLKYSGNQYHYHKFTKATGLAALTGIKITERTDGQFSGAHIKPSNYFFNQSRRSKKRIDKAHFSGNKAVGSYKGTPYNVAVSANILDRASLELALARDLIANKPRLSYQVLEKGKIKNYTFAKQGQQKVKTAAGTFNTIKVAVIRSNNKRQTTFWMAKELNYMPVKIIHKEKGDVITTVIKNYKL